MYKFDLHCHCAEGSFCAKASLKELIPAYKKAGYDGIVLTNHFIRDMIGRFGDYRSLVENQWQTHLQAKAVGEACGLTVLFGFEFRYQYYDFLVYGLSPDFLLANPDLFAVDFAEFSRRVHAQSGFIIQAHPFRYVKQPLYVPLDGVDAYEIYNGSHCSGAYPTFYNDMAEMFAREMEKIGTAGSDTHRVTEDGLPHRHAATLFEHPVSCIEDLIEQIKNQTFQIEK